MSGCNCCQGLTTEDPRWAELDSFMETARTIPGSLISVLHKAQHLFGYLPEEVLSHVAKGLHIPSAEVYGVVTFYNYFSTEPVGKFPISVCMGTACYVQGADRLLAKFESELGIKPGQVTGDGLFSLESCRCIGACGLAPVITIQGEVHGKLTEHDVPRLLAQIRQQAIADGLIESPERELATVGSERE
ncbi:MAG TPA: NAD(P)H-dependent oxidoreductase subunit E [Symbiobacteriaceae bacterium]|nr:NAD(P)H-dependent oxidoreductase subunit E [Symbiobacteriaceae bacterium]